MAGGIGLLAGCLAVNIRLCWLTGWLGLAVK